MKMNIIKENKIVSSIIAIAALFSAIVGIGKSIDYCDTLIVTEAEAKEMVQQTMIPAQRRAIETDISGVKREIFILEQKAQYQKDEPWEKDLLKKLNTELGKLEEDKAELNK